MSVILSAPAHVLKSGPPTVLGVEWRLYIYTPTTVYDGLGGTPDPSQNLVAFNIQKSFQNPIGMAAFTLTVQSSSPSVRWDQLPLMSLVVFQIRNDTPTSPFITRFIGYITDIKENWTTTPSGVQRFVTLTCQDPMIGFGVPMFFPTSVMVAAPNQALAPVEELFKKLYFLEGEYALGGASLTSFLGYMVQAFTNGQNFPQLIAPSEAFWYLFSIILPNFFNPITQLNSPYVSSPRIGWKDLFTLFLVPSSALKWSLLYPPAQSSWWQNMQPWINAPFFEVFGDVRTADELGDLLTYDASLQSQSANTDTKGSGNSLDPTNGGTQTVGYGAPGHAVQFDSAGGRFCFVYRNAPFSPKNWESLIQTSVGDTITMMDRHRNTSSVLNVYETIDTLYLQAINTQSAQAGSLASLLMPMVFDEQSVLTYGIQNPMQAQIGAYSSELGPNNELMLRYSLMAWAWYHHNPDFWVGQFTTRGNPKLRIGQRVYVEEYQMDAYIEGITESASIIQGQIQPYQSTVQFSRGMEPALKQQVFADWDAAQQLAGSSSLLNIVNQNELPSGAGS